MTTISLAPEAQTVIDEAQRFAEEKHHSNLDGPHLFRAIIHHSDVGRDWLNDARADMSLLDILDSAMDKLYRQDAQETEPSPTYILTMRAAQDNATQSRIQQITPAHLLKAVLDTDDMLNEWLKEHGIRSVDVTIVSTTPLLDELGRDLTRLARKGELSSVIGREEETRQLVEVLLRQGKNNALLLGLPGVGKTAVVEQLAQKIAAVNVPAKLAKTRLVELNVSNLVAGTTYRGEFEERLLELLREIRQTDDVIVVIDEFHTLMGAGTGRDNGLDAANILKPALARGELTCIGITTHDEYCRFIEKDQAFARRFEIITVQEPNETSTRSILAGIAPRYQKYHGVTVQPTALDAIVKLASQYLPNRQFPDKAIDILGRACSRAEIAEMTSVDEILVTAIVSEMAGVPVGKLTIDAQDMLRDLEERLAESVIGQDQAIAVLARAVRLAYAGLRDPRRPKGVFMFVGPSGVGKTQLAKSLASLLFGDEKALVRLDMSEYSEKYTVSRLMGAPPGYVGHDEPGQLTDPLRSNPHSIVLLDEIEKAHPEVFDIFLQLFDEGRLTDSQGRSVDGRHAIFIMTSNLGAAQINKRSFGFDPTSEQLVEQAINEAVQTFFRPEFLNRIDHIVHFRQLAHDDLVEIAHIELEQLKRRMNANRVRLTYESDIADVIARKATASSAGARSIKRVVEEVIAVPVSDMLINPSSEKHDWLHIENRDGELMLGWV